MTTSTQQMASGVLPYDISAPFWSDGAAKDRWFAIPNATTISVQSSGDWTFPNNSVLIKHFRIGNVLSETRLLVKHSNGGWGGYSYEWNAAGTDATYIPNGKTKTIGTQQYIYPSSADCMQCHTSAAATALGPKTNQMNRNHLLCKHRCYRQSTRHFEFHWHIQQQSCDRINTANTHGTHGYHSNLA